MLHGKWYQSTTNYTTLRYKVDLDHFDRGVTLPPPLPTPLWGLVGKWAPQNFNVLVIKKSTNDCLALWPQYLLSFFLSCHLAVKTLNSFVQALLGQWRSFYMKVINSSAGNWIMELEHPASCSCPVFCPWAGPAMTVRMPTGEVLGHIKHA